MTKALSVTNNEGNWCWGDFSGKTFFFFFSWLHLFSARTLWAGGRWLVTSWSGLLLGEWLIESAAGGRLITVRSEQGAVMHQYNWTGREGGRGAPHPLHPPPCIKEEGYPSFPSSQHSDIPSAVSDTVFLSRSALLFIYFLRTWDHFKNSKLYTPYALWSRSFGYLIYT